MNDAGRRTLALLAALSLAAAPALAQGGGERARERAPATRGQPSGQVDRGELERRFVERLTAVVQRELRTTPEQTRQLAAVARRFEAERRPLFAREMATRRELRRELADGTTPNQERVEAAMRELLQVQRRRLDVLEAEQRALSAFLTPAQRARYLALQENLRHRVEQRGGRDGPMRASPRGRPPG